MWLLRTPILLALARQCESHVRHRRGRTLRNATGISDQNSFFCFLTSFRIIQRVTVHPVCASKNKINQSPTLPGPAGFATVRCLAISCANFTSESSSGAYPKTPLALSNDQKARVLPLMPYTISQGTPY